MPNEMIGLELKGLVEMEVKDEAQGLIEAVVATLGVVDKDLDVITADAIKSGAKVKMSSYGHDVVYGSMPVGKGSLSVVDDKVLFKGKVFLNTQRGLETFNVLKEMGSAQEWSFGFRILGSEVPDEAWRKKGAMRILTKLDAFEVSPVVIAAGENTRTTSVKTAEPVPTPLDPVVEAARLAAERQARAIVVANEGADRLFRRGLPR